MNRFAAYALTIATLLAIPSAPMARAEAITFDLSARHTLIDGVEAHVKDYVFEDRIPKIEAAIEAARPSLERIDDPAAFAKAVTETLYGVSHDKHMYLGYREVPVKPNGDAAFMTSMDVYNGEGVGTFSRLPGNIGYLDIRPNFPTAEESADAFAAVMTLAATTDALIIDVRRNGGGSTSNHLLLSYLLAPKTPIVSLHFRGQKPLDIVSLPNVKGPRYLTKPVIVLTSGRTASAAEGFAYALQATHRATIVGATTAGAGNPNKVTSLNDHFYLSVAIGETVSPYTHTGWEGVGVQPDVQTDAADALVRGYTIALQKSTNGFAALAARRADALSDPAATLSAIGLK